MQSGIAVIKVNDIEVGSMPISLYEDIVESVKNDWKTRIAVWFSYVQLLWKMVLRLCSHYVQNIVIIFALLMLYSFFNSTETILFIDQFRNAPSKEIAGTIHFVININFILTGISYTLSLLIKGTPEFKDAYESSIANKIRKVMEVPAEGKVSIIYIQGNGDAAG
ncbi:hypothetical protein Q4Q75_17955 [Morganella morganii]